MGVSTACDTFSPTFLQKLRKKEQVNEKPMEMYIWWEIDVPVAASQEHSTEV